MFKTKGTTNVDLVETGTRKRLDCFCPGAVFAGICDANKKDRVHTKPCNEKIGRNRKQLF